VTDSSVAPFPPTPAPGRGLRLDWPGRSWEPGHLAATFDRIVATEIFSPSDIEGARSGRLVAGDALAVARSLAAEGLAGAIDLVYVDPPFASQMAYVHEARLDGPADGRVVRATAYDDRWEREGIGSYLDMLAPRLEALVALLAPTGTVWVHVDWRAAYLVRVLLDELLGRDAFVNEIVWRRAPNLGRQAASHQFGRTLDTLVVYGKPEAKLVPPTRLEPIEASAVRRDAQGRPFTTAPRGDYTDESIARLEAEGRVHRTASGRVYVKYFLVENPDGTFARERRVDALWTDVPPLRHARAGERTGYPTQKPRALLDRVIESACPRAGTVVDLFAGSGTTAESAHALGRRFIVGDASPLALGTARARLLRAGARFTVERCGEGRGEGRGDEALAGHAPAGVTASLDGDRIRVALSPAREPLAWAIEAPAAPPDGEGPRAPFRTAWHSERVPGSRVRPAAPEGAVARVADSTPGSLRVRIWYDDGGIETIVAPVVS
jgi:DNA modification methylase